MQLLSNMSQP